jgi:hypothetical protein
VGGPFLSIVQKLSDQKEQAKARTPTAAARSEALARAERPISRRFSAVAVIPCSLPLPASRHRRLPILRKRELLRLGHGLHGILQRGGRRAILRFGIGDERGGPVRAHVGGAFSGIVYGQAL